MDTTKYVYLGRTSSSKQNHLNVQSRWPDIWMCPPESVIKENDTIVIPEYVSKIKPELELGVVINERCHNVTDVEAKEYIGSLTICNDLTARSEWPGYSDPAFGRSGFGYKMIPTFNPIYSNPVNYDDLDDIGKLSARLYVDDSLILETSPKEYVFSIGDMISFASKICVLNEGDVVSLGGMGHHNKFIDTSEVVTCVIDGIGELNNPILRKR